MKNWFFDCGTRDSMVSLGLLVTRVSIGLLMLLGHGIPKIQGFAAKKDGFPVPDVFPINMMSSPVSLSAAIFAEAFCAVLLIVGFATRPAAFIFAFTMTVAAFVYHGSDPWFSQAGPSKEMAVLYLVPALAILLTGAGSYSVDSTLSGRNRRR